jgi:glyoxylase-like metal-dependent hydrolase (beta-lactamase superfamily II)
MSISHRFQVGEFECIAVNDGTFSYPVAWMFANVPEERCAAHLAQQNLSTTHVESPYTCLLLRTGTRNVLVDTGADGLAPTTGNLLNNLQAIGVSAHQITDVVLTHAHPDHIGGAVDPSGKPAFAQACYWMSKIEWDFWTSPTALHDVAMDAHMRDLLVGCAQRSLPPLAGQLELIEGEKEILPGLRAIAAPGHTPGHMALVISSSKTQLLHLADTVLHPLHLENPDWRNIFDLDEPTAVETRQRLFDRASAEQWQTLAYHFPFPGLGRVGRKNRGWTWTADLTPASV